MFALLDKEEPDIQNIKGLNFALVKLTTVQVTKLPLLHKLCKVDMIYFAKPVLKRTCI
jgi:hypothetical protein